MSVSIIALKGIQEIMQNKFENGVAKAPSYHKEGDIYSTSHFYTQTTVLDNGKILTIGITIGYIPYGGVDYELTIQIQFPDRDKSQYQRIKIERGQITTKEIANILRSKGLKI